MLKHSLKLIALGCALGLPGVSSAFTVYDSFGALPGATWGGSGIPNDAVAASKQIVNGSDTITVGMVAHERYSNPPVSDNGAAIYTAGIGSNCGVATDPVGCPSGSQGALWNWGYYIDIAGGGVLTDYQIDIYYDLDPAGPNALGDLSGLGRIDVTAGLNATAPAATLAEGSENLLFGFLAVDNLPFIDAPGGSFDPNATGNYQFAITISTLGGGFPIDSVAMEVQVVPVPAAAWLFGSALGLLGWIRSRRTA